jgi:hypothetical protein
VTPIRVATTQPSVPAVPKRKPRARVVRVAPLAGTSSAAAIPSADPFASRL